MKDIISDEIEFNNHISYQLGSYLYMGMAIKKEKKVCIAVAYKIDYCIKKIDEFLSIDSDITFSHINKIKIGETKSCQKFYIDKPFKTYYS